MSPLSHSRCSISFKRCAASLDFLAVLAFRHSPLGMGGSETYALVVDDLDDSGQATGLGASLEDDDTADLDEAPLRGSDVDVTHFGDGLCVGGMDD